MFSQYFPSSIVIRSERITVTNGTQSTDVTFPQEGDLENFTISSGLSPAVITIPTQLIVERSNCKWQLRGLSMRVRVQVIFDKVAEVQPYTTRGGGVRTFQMSLTVLACISFHSEGVYIRTYKKS